MRLTNATSENVAQIQLLCIPRYYMNPPTSYRKELFNPNLSMYHPAKVTFDAWTGSRRPHSIPLTHPELSRRTQTPEIIVVDWSYILIVVRRKVCS